MTVQICYIVHNLTNQKPFPPPYFFNLTCYVKQTIGLVWPNLHNCTHLTFTLKFKEFYVKLAGLQLLLIRDPPKNQ